MIIQAWLYKDCVFHEGSQVKKVQLMNWYNLHPLQWGVHWAYTAFSSYFFLHVETLVSGRLSCFNRRGPCDWASAVFIRAHIKSDHSRSITVCTDMVLEETAQSALAQKWKSDLAPFQTLLNEGLCWCSTSVTRNTLPVNDHLPHFFFFFGH